ncbi:MAG: hypothetical protein ACK5Z5_01030, partial [Neisseriaceae bacterium]
YIEVYSSKYYGPLNGNMRFDRAIYINQDGIEYEGKFVNNKLSSRTKVTYTNGDIYIGNVKELSHHGKGRIDYPNGGRIEAEFDGDILLPNKEATSINFNGYIYKGPIIDGTIHGPGIAISNDGGVFEGNFIKGNFVSGKYTHNNGNTFLGNWTNGALMGKGVCIFANGDRYEGDFVEDKQHGKGVYSYANGDKYEGEFVEGKRHGKGVCNYANGDIYEGNFVEDKVSKGKYTYLNGHIYIGEWENNEAHGKGTVIYPNLFEFECTFEHGVAVNVEFTVSEYKYKGDFDSNWMINGEATIQIPGEYDYVGMVKDDVPEGDGTMTFPDGRVCKGKFVGGLPNDSEGEILYPNGDKYVGELRYGVRTGQGILYFKDGCSYQGEFNNDKLHGKGIFTDIHGKKHDVYYQLGELVKSIDSDSENIQTASIKESDVDIKVETEVNNTNITTEGEYKYPNGDTYKGTLVNGIPEGEGIKLYVNGDQYSGNFVAGIEAGFGKYTWDTGDSYEGYFVDGVPTIGGTYKCPEEDSKSENSQAVYEHKQQYDDLISNEGDTVQFDSKLISNSEAPQHIIEKFKLWIENVNRDGIVKVRQLRGMHDEPLKGVLKGYRSARLSSDYRVIYYKKDNQIYIKSLTKHKYIKIK